jgi:hypothetical protein
VLQAKRVRGRIGSLTKLIQTGRTADILEITAYLKTGKPESSLHQSAG